MTVRHNEENRVDEAELLAALHSLEANPLYLTEPTYRGNVEKWPDHQISFVDFHLDYIRSQPALDPRHYLANLRLKLRKSV